MLILSTTDNRFAAVACPFACLAGHTSQSFEDAADQAAAADTLYNSVAYCSLLAEAVAVEGAFAAAVADSNRSSAARELEMDQAKALLVQSCRIAWEVVAVLKAYIKSHL